MWIVECTEVIKTEWEEREIGRCEPRARRTLYITANLTPVKFIGPFISARVLLIVRIRALSVVCVFVCRYVFLCGWCAGLTYCCVVVF